MKELFFITFDHNSGTEVIKYNTMFRANIAFYIITRVFGKAATIYSLEVPKDILNNKKELGKYFVECYGKI